MYTFYRLTETIFRITEKTFSYASKFALQRDINVYFKFWNKYLCLKCRATWANRYIDNYVYLRSKLLLEYIEVVFVYVGSKLPYVFIFNEVVFSQAMFIYVNQRTVLFHTHSDEMDMDECLSRTFFFMTLHYTVLSFLSILCLI